MRRSLWFILSLSGILVVASLMASRAPACCAIGPAGIPIVNADQTVVILWDAAAKTQHFIRQASFKSEAANFGFLVPTPNQPELNESGNTAFPFLQKLTAPEIVQIPRPSGGGGCACGNADVVVGDKAVEANAVHVVEEKRVAGFDAVVLEASSANALIDWLNDHGYEFSPEAEAWAEPYIDAGWKITALKIAKDEESQQDKTVAASALRMTFQTDRPLFPYREPDSGAAANTLDARHRLLRIYFIGDARYAGELTKGDPWSGRVAWSNKVNTDDRTKLLELLNLPEDTGPRDWWLTEFEDHWAYRVAPADVYFSRDDTQDPVQRPPIYEYVSTNSPPDVMAGAVIFVMLIGPRLRRLCGRSRSRVATA